VVILRTLLAFGFGGASRAELRRRAGRIRLVIADNDGVLTDAGVYYSDRGEELKRYSLRDGMGVERLRDHGVETAILTGESTPQAARRAEKLRLRWCWLGVRDKLGRLAEIASVTGIPPDETAYIGDDVNDLGAIRAIGAAGITAAPSDAHPDVLAAVHRRLRAPGGGGAFRELADWIVTVKQTQRTRRTS
jgi:3-deoxy-D-manno-octulosonate 8-phosphate phosphatase (KDO 8-P phosphatase)